MAEIHTLVPKRRRAAAGSELDLAGEAIRRGVQYLAFRVGADGLQASYEPGPGHVNGHVARAAQAALRVPDALTRGTAPDAPLGLWSAAAAVGARFAAQLAEVKAGVTRAPATALRSAYLEALGEVMVEVVRRDGLGVLDAWAGAREA